MAAASAMGAASGAIDRSPMAVKHFEESVGLPQMSARQKKAASHDAPGSTIMAQSRVRIPPESTSDRVFRQTPSRT